MTNWPAFESGGTEQESRRLVGTSVESEFRPENKIWSAHKSGRTAFGMSIKAASVRNLEAARNAGLDFVRIDLSGNSVQIGDVSSLVRHSLDMGLTPVVRVASANQIEPVFAAGALGVTLPNITNSGQAAELVELCRREGGHLGGQLLVSVQIESVEALADVRTIAAIPGIHMLQSGRNDLAKSMGLPGQPEHLRVLEAEELIAKAAREAGKLLSLHFAPGQHSIQQAQSWLARNISCLTIGADTQILDEAVRSRVQSIRQSLWSPPEQA